jgi:Fe-S cluster assembly protein SufD
LTLAAALKSGSVAELPSRCDEDWRWTDLRGLIRTLPPASPAGAAPAGTGPFGDLGDAEVVVVNGRLQGDASALVLAPREHRTVRLRLISASAATSHGVRLAIEIGADAHLTLLESYEGAADGYLADTALDIGLDAGARLERVVIATDGDDAVSVSTAEVTLAPRAAFAQTVLTTGARRQRIETRVMHPGANAELRLDGAYIVSGRRHADQTTVVTHAGTDGVTAQLTKGVVRDQGRGVFQGRIVVAEGADRTDARMGHHALILSDRAEVDAKPELEIYADDVACAHGNTVGRLDEDALFYARQRGLPEDEAKALLTEAFVGEVIDRIAHDGAREVARAWAAEKLRG